MPVHLIAKTVQREAIREMEKDGELIVAVVDSDPDVWIYTQYRQWPFSYERRGA